VLLLVAVYALQGSFDWHHWCGAQAAGLLGLLTAPMLHGSVEHLAANSIALLILGTLAGSVYPRATCAPCRCCGWGPGWAWMLGDPGSHHLGASGVAHGLMFLVFVLGPAAPRPRPSPPA
jgi:membrane associated rhomboid family serine protease